MKAAYAKSTEAIRALKELTPDGGAYSNESDVHESDHTRESSSPRGLTFY